MKNAVRSEINDVTAALKRLGLPLEILQQAVQAGYVSRISRTANDAPNAAGIYQWNDTLRSLRENLAPLGWNRDDRGNWPTSVHPEGFLAIAVSSGNAATGNVVLTPSTKSAKGPRTTDAVNTNANQLWIPGLEPKQDQAAAVTLSRPTWFLLFHADEKELRAELSLPVSMGEDGHVCEWHERIILPAFEFAPSVNMPKPDFGPDIDIKIVRKG